MGSRLSAKTLVVGCSADTEVDTQGAVRRSVAVTGLSLDGIEVRTFQVTTGENQSRGKSAAEMLGKGEPSVVVALPDVSTSNGTRFLLEMQGSIGAHVPIVGGAPSVSGGSAKTFTFRGREVAWGGAAGFALYGPVEVSAAACSGYVPIGATRIITKVDGTAILEFDGRPALDVYREYVEIPKQEDRNSIVEFPLGVVDGPLGTQKQSDGTVKLVRAVFQMDQERNALVLGGDLQEGAAVRVLRAGSEDILKGAAEATQLALKKMTGKPDLALVFSCISRRTVLGPKFRDECKVAFSHLPEDVPKGGFYTFGELSPLAGVTMHHESTFTIALLRAKAS